MTGQDEHRFGGSAHEASERRPTLRDVAGAAGVSKSLVSLAFREPERVSDERLQRITDAAQRLGYRPNLVAGALKAARGDFVGILVADLHNPVFVDIVEAARRELAAHGRVGLVTSARILDARGEYVPDTRMLDTFADLRPSGVIVVGSAPGLHHPLLEGAGGDVVFASSIPDELPGALVLRGDEGVGMGLVVDHLVARGHRAIAHLGGLGGSVAEARARAYEAAVRRHGLDPIVVASDLTERGGAAAAAAALAERDDITALCAGNDLAAVGAVTAAADAGRSVPDDLAVVGYDDTYLAGLGPISLTTVRVDSESVGVLAARALLEEPFRPGERLLRPRLVVRRSSGSGREAPRDAPDTPPAASRAD
ncbi:LacI family transcriptional regulator [Pseudoclavibacter chungangensis]|uniref:LacI family transcriptional regulator n=1 Tax=Pseudoclavibacter chungangensis TaxID=587635 RepID=A0A7J5C1H6_9MICO|nr:LacI family DNA-binding transcriptional regulator [Pseudoclavibacter chungangensis]KAB1659592.1 LacI family transcriptional regulator [Pseudoclavibacter chungangensis]NYJ67414.1 DNA-binding LacI/PurR family transcriptional regulator [Pseudoclavibacter chungangensis]